MKVRRFFTAAAVGVATMLGAVAVAPAPAQAATSWSLSNSFGDVVGAWVHGTWWWGTDGRLYLTVNVKDTVANGMNASVSLGANYSDSGTRYEQVVNSLGVDSTITKTFSYASNVTSIYGYECADSICGSYARIF